MKRAGIPVLLTCRQHHYLLSYERMKIAGANPNLKVLAIPFSGKEVATGPFRCLIWLFTRILR